MADHTSRLARKLRAYRAGQGAHGRMTQEQLAERLGVSVDAIGKYERSLSFLRGDLEHRLAERLGWSREEILACREDWDARAREPSQTPYRLLDDALVSEVYGSWREASRASLTLADAAFGDLPAALDVNPDVFLPIYETYRDHWGAVLCDGEMVAKWALPFLLPEDEARFRAGRLLESELSVERIRQPILPGTYFGYCPALIVQPGHEAAGALLLSSFVRFLEDLAVRDVFLHGMGTVSCSPGGTQICRDLGMTRLTHFHDLPEFGVWNLPGAAIPDSLFGRRSAMLRQRYRAAFGAG